MNFFWRQNVYSLKQSGMQRQLTLCNAPIVPFLSSAIVVKLELVAQAQMPWARVLLQGLVLGQIGLRA